MGHYSKDKIYFAWMPKRIDKWNYIWLTWVRDVLYSDNGKNYQVVIRKKHRYVKWRVYRTD